MSLSSQLRYKLAPMSRAAIAAFFLSLFAAASDAYVLEGPRWAPGTNLVLQLSLGLPSIALQDGSTTWNQAVAPAIDTWNQNMGAIRVSGVIDSGVVPNNRD